jgi:hypothetical protein
VRRLDESRGQAFAISLLRTRDSASGTRTEVPKLGFHAQVRVRAFVSSDFFAELVDTRYNKKGFLFTNSDTSPGHASARPPFYEELRKPNFLLPIKNNNFKTNFAAQLRLTTAPTTCRDG